jgi:hypothetical protein
MPQAGVAARARRRNVVPWWEELDSEAFREFRAATIDEPTPPAVPFAPEPESDLHLERPVTWAPRADNGRRTVQITGRGAERNLPVARPIVGPTLRRHERAGFKPDRTAMWAVLLGLLLIIVAATSALPH